MQVIPASYLGRKSEFISCGVSWKSSVPPDISRCYDKLCHYRLLSYPFPFAVHWSLQPSNEPPINKYSQRTIMVLLSPSRRDVPRKCLKFGHDRVHAGTIPLLVALQPKFGLGRLPVEVSRSHKHTHTHTHTHRASRTPLDEWSNRRSGGYRHNTHLKSEKTSMPRRDSKPRSQQSDGSKTAPNTAPTPGSAVSH
jgi:hypothetical protein